MTRHVFLRFFAPFVEFVVREKLQLGFNVSGILMEEPQNGIGSLVNANSFKPFYKWHLAEWVEPFVLPSNSSPYYGYDTLLSPLRHLSSRMTSIEIDLLHCFLARNLGLIWLGSLAFQKNHY